MIIEAMQPPEYSFFYEFCIFKVFLVTRGQDFDIRLNGSFPVTDSTVYARYTLNPSAFEHRGRSNSHRRRRPGLLFLRT